MTNLKRRLLVFALGFLAFAGAAYSDEECTYEEVYVLNGVLVAEQRLFVTSIGSSSCCGADAWCVSCVGSSTQFWADVYVMDEGGNWVKVYSIGGCSPGLEDETWYRVTQVPSYSCAQVCEL